MLRTSGTLVRAVPEALTLKLDLSSASRFPDADVKQLLDEGRWDRVRGMVVVPQQIEVSAKRLQVVHAAHPLPDASSEQAARAALEAQSLRPQLEEVLEQLEEQS